MADLVTNTRLGLPTDYAGIHGRPMLYETTAPGMRHLAYVVDLDAPRDQWRWRTYCGLDVPADHQCPTDAQLRDRRVWTRTSCARCMNLYLH